MNIKVYRGSRQIGGCVVGVSTAKTRILIDMGTVLPDTKGRMPEENLNIEEEYDAVIFTHYHKDHTGLLEYISPHVPLYIGERAREIFRLMKEREESPLVERIGKMQTYRDGETFQVGNLKITPILTDHSAFDAYMLLVEGDGKRVLHTGDFRTHGLKGGEMVRRLAPLSGKVDVMITEGTNLSYENPITRPECDLAAAAETLMDRFTYTFVLVSPTDFDRLAVFHQAARSKSAFYCDAYQMKLIEAVRVGGEKLSPWYGFRQAKVYLPGLAEEPEGFCMAVRKGKAFQEIMKEFTDKDREKCLFISAVPEGYLKKHKAAIEKLTAGFRYICKLHTSGHASSEAIWETVSIVSPTKVIPIHTENPEKIRLGALQSWVIYLEDGQSYDIL